LRYALCKLLKGLKMAVFKKQQKKDEPYVRHEPVTPTPGPTTITSSSEMKNSIIGKTLFIKGNIFSDEEVLIEGKIEGKLNIKNLVVVGKSGVVNADIEANEVIVKGTVNGNVNGSNKVEIVPDGVLNGNILSKGVVLREGAIFKGSIDMTLKEE
jgi:cytoskeletal protein CcmA (bactofilin family)